MRAFNRAFAILVALLLLAAGAGLLYMIWSPGEGISVDRERMTAVMNFTLNGSDQVLATVIVGAAMALPLALLFYEIKPSRRREPADFERVPANDERYRELHQRIDELQRRVDDTSGGERRPVSPGEPVMAREGSYGEPHRRRWSLLNRQRS
jgi:hypothetical protein